MQTLFSRHQPQLANLTQQLANRLSLRECLGSCLSDKAQQALLDAYVDNHQLHLLTTSATWASRFRLSSRQLLNACNDQQVTELHVHIAAQRAERLSTHKTFTRSIPNETNLASLTSLSQQLNPQDELAQALQKLIQQLAPKA
jgi:hypothetical protein